MSTFLTVDGTQFIYNGNPILLQGFSLGSWLNIEHFMTGLPGTESLMKAAVEQCYGHERAERFWDTYRGCLVAEEDFVFLRSMQVNALRIPINYRLLIDDNDPGALKEDGFRHIDRVLHLCEKYRILAILDMHTAPGGQNPEWHSDNDTGNSLFWHHRDLRDRFIWLWQQIAGRYRDNPWVAGYDLLNEPAMCFPDYRVFTSFYDDLCQGIREVDRNHVLIIEGDWYAQKFTMFDHLPDPNCAFSIHFYPVHYEHHREALTADAVREGLRVKVDTLPHLQQVLNRPIWCGETSPIRILDGYEARFTALLSALESERISWTLWSYKDVRQMNLLHPAPGSPWMQFSRKACADWNRGHSNRRAEEMIEELYTRHGETDIPPHRLWHLKYRLRGSEHYPLVQRLSRLLESVPFEKCIRLPESFLLERCERYEPMYEIVRRYLRYPCG